MFSSIQDGKFTTLFCFLTSKMANSQFCCVFPHPRWQIYYFVIFPASKIAIHNFVKCSHIQDGKFTILLCFPASKIVNSLFCCVPTSKAANSLFCYVLPHPRLQIHYFVVIPHIQDCKFIILLCFPTSKIKNSLLCYVFPASKMANSIFCCVFPHPRSQIHCCVTFCSIQDRKFTIL